MSGIVLGDLHFGDRSFNKTLFNQMMAFFEKQLFPYIIENNIKYVIQVGDLTDARTVIDLWILQELKTRFFPWFVENKVKFYTLVGNHDSYFKDTISYNFQAHNVTEFYPWVIPVIQPKIIEIENHRVGFVPWIAPNDSFEIPKPDEVDLLVGHFEFAHFPYNKSITAHDGQDSTKFSSYKKILSGHYHIQSHKKNIHYLGTPYHLDWGDSETDVGFYVMDENLELEFHSNVISPRYVKLIYKDVEGVPALMIKGSEKALNDNEAKELVAKNHCRLSIEKMDKPDIFDAFFTDLNKHSFSTIETDIDDAPIESIEEVVQDQKNMDDLDVMRTYVATIGVTKNLNGDKLVTKIQTFYDQARQKSKKEMI